MTVDQALDHPYLSAYVRWLQQVILIFLDELIVQHDPEDEPVVASLDPEYFEFDSEFMFHIICVSLTLIFAVHKDDLSKDQLKGQFFFAFNNPFPLLKIRVELLYEEVMSFIPAISQP